MCKLAGLEHSSSSAKVLCCKIFEFKMHFEMKNKSKVLSGKKNKNNEISIKLSSRSFTHCAYIAFTPFS